MQRVCSLAILICVSWVCAGGVVTPQLSPTEQALIEQKLAAYEAGQMSLEELTGSSKEFCEELTAFYQLYPSRVSTRCKLPISRSFAILGRLPDALQVAKDYLSAYPNDWHAWRIVGAAEMANHSFVPAMQAYTNAVKCGDRGSLKMLAGAALGAERLDVVTNVAPALFALKKTGEWKHDLDLTLFLSMDSVLTKRKDLFRSALEGVSAEEVISRPDLVAVITKACRLHGTNTIPGISAALADYHRTQAQDLVSKGAWTEAVQEWSDCIALWPASASDYDSRGEAYRHLNDFTNAISDWSESVRLNPKDAWAYACLGVAHFVRKEDKLALSDLDKALRLDPQLASAFYTRGSAHAELGDLSSAITDFDQALRLEPSLGGAYFERGRARALQEEWAPAIVDLGMAIQLGVTNKAVYYLRGRAYDEKAEYKQAISDYSEAIHRDPAYAEAYYCRASAYAKERDWDKAALDCKSVVRFAGTGLSCQAFSLLGQVNNEKGEYQSALKAYEKALQLDSKCSLALVGEAWIRAACPLAALRDGNRAVALAEKALELSGGKDWRYKVALAAACAEAGDFARAKQLQAEVVASEPLESKDHEAEKERLRLYESTTAFRYDPANLQVRDKTGLP